MIQERVFFQTFMELVPVAAKDEEGQDDFSFTRHRHQWCVQKLSDLIRVRTGVAVCLGSGRANLSHKLHAQAHALRLESHSWHETAACFNQTLAFVTDFGTEHM